VDGTRPTGSAAPGDREMAGRSRRGRHRARPSLASAAESLTLLSRHARGLIGVSMLVAVVLCIPRITSEAKDEAPAARTLEAQPRVAERQILEDVPRGLCPIDWRRGTREVKQLIRCAASHYGIDQDEALYIAWRESRYQPTAYNELGDAAGVYQHKVKYWSGRAVEFGSADWSVFDARANILVTMRMVQRYGWEPWSL
jgi:soluble lytic murein transglycosylase-like protein